ncbi:uncharacterized protein [Triticum aestivum]|uniref:uncharacterized protein n=1 Tax=Triticum aestivum TaxID=4565 RepID=UPI001D0269A2|nr:uncharacterized protein LOC123117413 [Triticum aestivum]
MGTTGGGRSGEVALQDELGSMQTSRPARIRPSSPPIAATRDASLKEAAPPPSLDPPHQPTQRAPCCLFPSAWRRLLLQEGALRDEEEATLSMSKAMVHKGCTMAKTKTQN